MNRLEFLQTILGTSIIGANKISQYDGRDINSLLQAYQQPVTGQNIGLKTNPIPQLKIGIIGLGNRGKTLIQMLQYMIEQKMATVTALCDLTEVKTATASEMLGQWQIERPRCYFGGEDSWKKVAQQDDVDLLLITTPWRYHAPMCIYGMEQGKHVASEVPIAYSLSDCWNLIATAERTQKHCIMIENCCYNEEELFVLNMIQEGVFGDLTHAEGAYLHDLRAHLLSSDYYQRQWRLEHHRTRNGNFYTTHGLGPISMYLEIGRGDNYTHLTSMSSRELNLSSTAQENDMGKLTIACGDMNTTMIKTALGKTVMLQFDVHTGRPYSRINKVVGTQAVHDGYPSRLYVDKPELEFWGHRWLPQEEYDEYRSRFQHPMISKLKQISQEFKQGHGGMDFVMMYRLVKCLNLGLPLDINVYDGVLWSAITPLSELSVMNKSETVIIPDFTGGEWKTARKLEIMRGQLTN